MKIKRIELQNFKQFERFSVSCRDTNILTGPNNAGKSSVLDALRILGDIIRYSFRKSPVNSSYKDKGVSAHYSIPQSALSIPIENVTKNYSDEPAEIRIITELGVEIIVVLHHDRPVLAYLFSDGRPPISASEFRKKLGLELCIVPTLGPFEEEEDHYVDATISANRNTRRAARNYRNIVSRMSGSEFETYRSLVRATWPEVDIEKPSREGKRLTMMYFEDRIPREVYWAGFGLQVWLQMCLQLLRGNKSSVFILDEPDIYLHADLQRRLVRVCKEKFGQLFLATHSTEIINEVDSGDVLMIRKKSRGAKRVTDESSYKELFQYLGSSENAEFARLARAKRILFYEGNDHKILRKFSKKIRLNTVIDDPETVVMRAGGFGQWQRVANTGWTLTELFDIDVKIAALFDRDYRSADEVVTFLEGLASKEVTCRVLSRKEIENYCLVSANITRAVLKKAALAGQVITQEEILDLCGEITDEMKIETTAQLQGCAHRHHKRTKSPKDDSEIAKEIMTDVENKWKSLDERLKIVGGKTFASKLSGALQSQYKFSISISNLIESLGPNEIDRDLFDIIDLFDQTLSA